jgi:hypothetical protein
MSLIERLRTAEHQGRGVALEGLSWARTNLEEAQSKIRRKMRLYPRTAKPAFPSRPMQAEADSAELEEREPIVSINGEDVLPEDLEPEEEKASKNEGQAA